MILSFAIDLAERGLVPNAAVRAAIRQLCQSRLEQEGGSLEDVRRRQQALLDELRAGAVAVLPEKANEQHYEVPAAFFELVLGKRLKYSSAHFRPGLDALDDAEEDMLALTCERARLEDGQDVLELGCGWGSLTLWMAERFPRSRIHAVSNSASQRAHILEQARRRGLANVTIQTEDVNSLVLDRTFDRVVSVEMFEHVRNHDRLFSKIAGWLAPGGQLFVHVFCHRELAYLFEATGEQDWMAREFFSGGMMPSDDWLLRFQRELVLEDHWRVSGEHYARTARAWLANLDANRDPVRAVLAKAHGERDADRWVNRWRIFFLSCEELFGFAQGEEWHVAHYRFGRARR